MALTPEEELELLNLEEEELLLKKKQLELQSEQPATEQEELEGVSGLMKALFPTATSEEGLVEDVQPAGQVGQRLPQEELAQITQPFSQVEKDPSAARLIQGTVVEPLDVPRRAAGAVLGEIPGVRNLVGRPEGQSFLQALADPKTGAFRRAKEIVEESNAPEAAKFIADLGLSVAEDPLTFLSGVIGAARSGIKRAGRREAAKAVAKEGVEVPGDIAKKAAEAIPGGAPITSQTQEIRRVSPELRFTPAQQQVIEGKPLTKGMIEKERKALGQTQAIKRDVQKDLEQGNIEAVSNKLQDIRTKFGFAEDPVEKLRVSTEENLSTLKERFDDKMSGVFTAISKKADEAGNLPEEALGTIDNTIREITEDVAAKTPQTPEEVAELLRKGQLDILGKGKAKISGLGPKTAAELGLEPKTLAKISNIQTRLKQGVPFSTLKSERTKLGNFIWNTTKQHDFDDYQALTKMYDSMTEAMEKTLSTNFSPELVNEFKSANRIFSAGTRDFKVVQDLMKKTTPKVIIRELNRVPKNGKDLRIKSLKRVLPEESFQEFRNLYFNDIISRAGKKIGDNVVDVDSEKLLNVLKEQPPIVFNETFTKEMGEEIVSLVENALVKDFSKTLNLLPKDPNGFLKKLKNNHTLRYALIIRGMSPAKIVTGEVTRQVAETLFKKRGADKAEAFLRQVDEESLFPAYLKGAGSGGGVSVGAQKTRLEAEEAQEN